jgi:hypothetical protein
LLWGLPAVLVIGAGIAYGESVLSLTGRGIISCGRVHCRIDGIAFPLLALVGALNVFSIISFDWNLFWIAFFVIFVGSFVPEWTWKKYA